MQKWGIHSVRFGKVWTRNAPLIKSTLMSPIVFGEKCSSTLFSPFSPYPPEACCGHMAKSVFMDIRTASSCMASCLEGCLTLCVKWLQPVNLVRSRTGCLKLWSSQQLPHAVWCELSFGKALDLALCVDKQNSICATQAFRVAIRILTALAIGYT